MERWFVIVDGVRKGPFNLEQLDGELLALPEPGAAQVWRQGMAGWTVAGQVPEIKARLPRTGNENEPFPIPENLAFTIRLLDIVSSGHVTGRARLTLGETLRDDAKWMCLFNLEALEPTRELMGKGVAQGADQLQTVLRAVQLARTSLVHLAQRYNVQFLWQGAEHAGLPDMGTQVP